MTALRRLASSHWASVACTRDATDVTIGSDDVGGTRSSEAEIVDSPPLATVAHHDATVAANAHDGHQPVGGDSYGVRKRVEMAHRGSPHSAAQMVPD